jgi:hypothetical protein
MPFARPRSAGIVAAAAGVMLLIVNALAAIPARADSVCDMLNAQLSALPRGQASPMRSGPLMRQLRQAQSAAQQYGCTFRFFGMPASPFCPGINGQIAQLRRQLAGSGGSIDPVARYQRHRILGEMARYGCVAPKRPPLRTTSLGGRSRTLCVRSCDGYFFPISYATPRSRLKIDEAVCKGMYPDGEATLFVGRGGDGLDGAVSLKGQAYAAQPYAFAYLKRFDPACKAKLTDGLAALAERFAAARAERAAKSGAEKSTAAVPLPEPRPAATEDPETVANRMGEFAIGTPTVPVALSAPAERPVRIVGAGLFPLPPNLGTAENLAKPARQVGERQPMRSEMLGLP